MRNHYYQDHYFQNAALLVLNNIDLKSPDQLNILHYLYLNGIDIHSLARSNYNDSYTLFTCREIEIPIKLSKSVKDKIDMVKRNFIQYLKVISQDFDYQNNEHDYPTYGKPSFWKEFHYNKIKKNNNKKISYKQSKRINEWKNRFDEHVLHHLSIMIQEWMLKSKDYE